ncbi:MAG: helix-turn-helix domain-containing protein [Chloroflexi bacterium]|nr:helix-turn-helix domain-containing protein [Chloroflexota bacterium]
MQPNAEYPPTQLAYTFCESMRILRISRSTMNRLLVAGQLKSKKVGGRRLITHKELDRFLDVPDD